MVANILPADTLDPRDGFNGQNSTFSEYGHVAYQINGSLECSKMVANILPADLPTHPPPPTVRGGVNGQNSAFAEQGHVAY